MYNLKRVYYISNNINSSSYMFLRPCHCAWINVKHVKYRFHFLKNIKMTFNFVYKIHIYKSTLKEIYYKKLKITSSNVK